jgi:glycosyltransferase involved in cell wall biosynthesis
LVFARRFRQILGQHGPYDVVHFHCDMHAGYALWLARMADVRVRIAHSHNDYRRAYQAARSLRRGYFEASERLIWRYATLGLAASEPAARSLFGPRWRTDSRFQVLHCGVDLTPFSAAVEASDLRRGLDLPERGLVLGHVGRFAEQKNHAFLLEIMKEVVRRRPEARLLLIGDGPLMTSVQRQASHLGLTPHVVFTGLRSDVARLMLGAMDVFVMPSYHEGLPLAGIEAQAAGLPCFFSSDVTTEADIVRPLVRHLTLAQGPSAWAEAVLESTAAPRPISRSSALATVERSSFNICRSYESLERYYLRGLSGSRSRDP